MVASGDGADRSTDVVMADGDSQVEFQVCELRSELQARGRRTISWPRSVHSAPNGSHKRSVLRHTQTALLRNAEYVRYVCQNPSRNKNSKRVGY